MPEYHGWTHAPKAQGGTDPIPGVGAIPTFRAQIPEGGGPNDILVASGTIQEVKFDYWEIGDPSYFSVTTDASSPVKARFINCLQVGLYSINFDLYWASDPNCDTTLIMNEMQGYAFPHRVTHGHTTDQFGGLYQFQVVKTFYPYDPLNINIDPLAPPSPVAKLLFQANQNSGVNQTVYESYLEINYLGTPDVTVPTVLI